MGERCGTGGQVIGGFQGRGSRFEVWVIHLVWTFIFDTRGEVMGFQGDLKIPGGEWNGVPM